MEENKTKQTDITSDVKEELSDVEIAEMQEQIKKNVGEKKASKEDKVYSQKDLDYIIEKMRKDIGKRSDNTESDLIDLLADDHNNTKYVRIARINGKFVVGAENINDDPYIDNPVYIRNEKNPRSESKLDYIPFIKLKYHDGTSEDYPYLSFLDRAQGVWAEIINQKDTDNSETFGAVEVNEVINDGWGMGKTGNKILGKAKKVISTYTVKEIKNGETFKIEECDLVLNKANAPVEELKKYIESK